jgi:hypothetical protein
MCKKPPSFVTPPAWLTPVAERARAISREQPIPFVFEQVVHDHDGQSKVLAPCPSDLLLPMHYRQVDHLGGARAVGRARAWKERGPDASIFEQVSVAKAA